MITADLLQILASFKGQRVTLIGVGNSFRRDDGFGPALVRALGRHQADLDWILIDAGTAPENFTATVRRSEPDVVVIADCGDLGMQPGLMRIAKVGELAGGGLSTHTPSLSLVADIWQKELGVTVYVLAIQPLEIAFGEGLSVAVRARLQALVEVVVESAGR